MHVSPLIITKRNHRQSKSQAEFLIGRKPLDFHIFETNLDEPVGEWDPKCETNDISY